MSEANATLGYLHLNGQDCFWFRDRRFQINNDGDVHILDKDSGNPKVYHFSKETADRILREGLIDADMFAQIIDNLSVPIETILTENGHGGDPVPSGKDQVNQPSHYAGNGIETIDALHGTMSDEEFNGFLKGNIIKYVTRAGKKDAIWQDLNKVIWYAMFLYLSNGGTVDGLAKTYEYMRKRFAEGPVA